MVTNEMCRVTKYPRGLPDSEHGGPQEECSYW